MCGLPKSMSLLGELAASSDKFMSFLENLNDTDSFKIFDYLFMPLKFVQLLIDFMQSIQKVPVSNHAHENTANTLKLKQIIADLYQCKYLNIFGATQFFACLVFTKANKCAFFANFRLYKHAFVDSEQRRCLLRGAKEQFQLDYHRVRF